MKVGIITFHASHNYGSMLQAYALQQTVLSLGHQCEIINLRLPVQRKIYRPFFMQSGIRKKLKALRYPKLAIDDFRKYRLFEKFLREKYVLTSQEYTSSDELKAADLDFDCYISGSDQIWNTSCWDFNTAYFLDFVANSRKIAYAPSMGPNAVNDISTSLYEYICENIKQYDSISVREQDTNSILKNIIGSEFAIVADPTLLLQKKQWDTIAGNRPMMDGDYILLYTPWYDKHRELYEQAAKLAHKENMTVICTLQDGYRQWHNHRYFKYITSVGPVEFLNLIKHSCYVMCGSFHAVIFSLVFNRPFYAYQGMDDSRMSHILQLLKLEQAVDLPQRIPCFDYSFANERIMLYADASRKFLINTLK